MISEKLNTRSRINRRLSITVSAVVQVRNTEQSGNRIIPARMPGMTTPDSANRKPQAFQQAVTTQSSQGILRATWMKTTAAAQHWTDRHLIGTNQQQQRVDQQDSHSKPEGRRLKRVSISVRHSFRCARSPAFTSATGWARRRTTSQDGISNATNRKASRPCRLIALRTEAALASRFGTISPNRALLSVPAFRK
jgi:hypothetical protein